MSVDCSHLHGRLGSSSARRWLVKRCALQLNTKPLEVAKSLAVFTWVKVCVFLSYFHSDVGVKYIGSRCTVVNV